MKQRTPVDRGGSRSFTGAWRTIGAAYPQQAVSVQAANVEALCAFLRYSVFAILLTRSICDPIFSSFEMDLAGSPIGFGAVINAAVIAIALVFLLTRPARNAAFEVFAIWTPFLLVALAAIFYAPQFGSAARMFLVFVSYWALFIIPFFMFRSRDDLPRFVLLVLASSIVPSLYAIVDTWRGLSDFSEFRLQSTFAHPNIYSFYLVLLLGLAFYFIASHAITWPRARRAVTLYIPILILFIALTKTRSAWIAAAAIYLFYAVRFDRRLLLGILLVPILLALDPSLGDRFLDLTRGEEIEDLSRLNSDVTLNSLEWRRVLWESAIPAILQKPLLGHGLDSFRISTPTFFPLAVNATETGETDAHNFYLQILFEMGTIGIFAFIWLFGALSWRLARGLRFDRAGILLIFSILAAYLAESHSDNMAYYLSFNWYFWFVMGTICAWIGYMARLDTPAKPSRFLKGPERLGRSLALAHPVSGSRVSGMPMGGGR